MQYAVSAPHLAYVIEDEVYLAEIFAKALTKAGFQTLEITDGQQAIEHLRETQDMPRLVVLDVNLPLVSGKDILRFIRADARFDKTRVILATSESAGVLGELEANSDIVLLKPVSYTLLRELASRFH